MYVSGNFLSSMMAGDETFGHFRNALVRVLNLARDASRPEIYNRSKTNPFGCISVKYVRA